MVSDPTQNHVNAMAECFLYKMIIVIQAVELRVEAVTIFDRMGALLFLHFTPISWTGINHRISTHSSFSLGRWESAARIVPPRANCQVLILSITAELVHSRCLICTLGCSWYGEDTPVEKKPHFIKRDWSLNYPASSKLVPD